MYEPMKDAILELLNAPKNAPEPPAGAHGSVKIFRASPRFLSYRFLFLGAFLVVLSILFLFAAVALLFRHAAIGIAAVVVMALLWILILGLGYILIRLEYEMRYYVVTDRSLRIRKGVLNILEQTLTFANIQNISIEQGPVERLFGISSLVVETAGGGSVVNAQQNGFTPNYHQAVLDGLDDAETLRDLIREYLKTIHPSSGLGERLEKRRAGRRGGFGPAETAVLRDILSEIRMLRGSRGGGAPQTPPPAPEAG